MAGLVRNLIIGLVGLGAVGGGGYALTGTASKTHSFAVEAPANSVFTRLSSTPDNTQLAEGVTLTHVTSAANNVVVGDVSYANGATGRVTYTVRPDGDGSNVDLKLEQNMGPNPMDRIGAITGGPVADVAQAAATAAQADLGALPDADYAGLQYDVVDVAARPFFFVENCSSSDAESITSIIAQAVAGIPPVMRTKGIQPNGPLTAVEPRVVSGQYCYQVGYPYSGPAPRGALLIGKAGQTPGGSMLHVHYTGTEADVTAQVYDRLDALLGAAHLDKPGDPSDDWATFEVYNDDPMQPGGSRNREIYYVTQGDISRLAAIVPPTAAAAPTAPAPAATDTTATTTATTAPAPTP